MRHPTAAGRFYSDNPEELKHQLEESFKKGPGLPDKGKKHILGAISPHAGYMFSGKGAAYIFKEIAESDTKTFIILGPSHTGLGGTAQLLEDFETPLGTAKINKDIKIELPQSAISHMHEHSIEVQLPFLQYVKKDFTFIPISVSHDMEPKLIAEKILTAIENKDVCIIASSDFTHYGHNYGYTPNVNVKELDMGAIKHILNLDPEGFLKYVNKTGATICGAYPIAILLYIMKKKNAKAELLNYYTSADIMKDNENSVSYASIIFHAP